MGGGISDFYNTMNSSLLHRLGYFYHQTIPNTGQHREQTRNKKNNKKHITIYNVSSSSSNKSTTGCPVLVVFNASQLMISEQEGTETEIKE